MAMLTNESMKDYIFYACVVGCCKVKFNLALDSPASVSYINGYIITINNELFDKHELLERADILKHECLHISSDHLSRFKKEIRTNQSRVNVAADCSINQYCYNLPNGHITLDYCSELADKRLLSKQTAEYYYNEIPDEGKTNSSHNGWDSINDADMMSSDSAQILSAASDQTINIGGKVPGNIELKLKDATRKYYELDRYCNFKSGKRLSHKRKNKRYPHMAGNVKDRKLNALIVLDVSGSVSNIEVVNILSEVKNIISRTDGSEISVIQVDEVAHPPEVLKSSTRILSRLGNGGTRLYSAIAMAKAHRLCYDLLIIMTDGYLFKDDIDSFEALKCQKFFIISKTGTSDIISGLSRSFFVKL